MKNILKNAFLPEIKNVVRDLAKQALLEKINNECSFLQYPSIFTDHGVQKYLKKMPPDIWIPLIKIRTSNHKLLIQFHSLKIVLKPRENRACIIIMWIGGGGDEMH